MYHGEVNVAQEDLDVFLALAQDLQIKGLTQKNEEEKANIAETKQNQSEPPCPKVRRTLNLTDTSTPKKPVETSQPIKPLPPKQELVNYDDDYIFDDADDDDIVADDDGDNVDDDGDNVDDGDGDCDDKDNDNDNDAGDDDDAGDNIVADDDDVF